MMASSLPQHLCFFTPSPVIGGNETLFARIGYSYAVRHPEATVYYPDLPGGAVSSVLRNYPARDNIRILPFTPGDRIDLPDDTVVVAASHVMRFYNGRFMNETFANSSFRFLFWILDASGFLGFTRYGHYLLSSIGYRNTVRLFFMLRYLELDTYRLARQALGFLIKRSALVSMTSAAHWEMCEFYRLPDPELLYVMVDRFTSPRTMIPIHKVLKLGWLGRFEGAKLWAINNVLIQLDMFCRATGLKVEMTLIGMGRQTDYIISRLKELSFPAVCIGPLTGEALENEIKTFDILFACGTSAVEGVKLAVPTVAVDAEFKKFKREKFGFFYTQSSGGAMAGYLGLKESSKVQKRIGFEEIVRLYKTDAARIASQGYQVYQENFSEEKVIHKFESFLKSDLPHVSEIETLWLHPTRSEQIKQAVIRFLKAIILRR